MIDCVFGFGLVSISIYDDDNDPNVPRKLCVYVSESSYWKEEEECSDYLEEESSEALWEIGLGQECEGIFSLNKQCYREGHGMVDVPQLTKDELSNKLVKMGFLYNEGFENYMIKNGSPG